MQPGLLYELIGYLASILIAISLMMSSILKLRLINLAGSAIFTVYGLLIGSYPVAAVNFFIVLINLCYLYEIYSTQEYFRLLEVDQDSSYLDYFLSFYAEDIRRFQPGFSYAPAEGQRVLFVLRDLVPAGLIVAEMRGPDALCVNLDYVIPRYRDFKIGQFVYQERAQFFIEQGIRTIYTAPGSPAHAAYLRRMGFRPRAGAQEQGLYRLDLEPQEAGASR